MAGNGLSFATNKALADLDREGVPQPAQPASAPSGSFVKPFTPDQKAKQKAALVDALRRRAAEDEKERQP